MLTKPSSAVVPTPRCRALAKLQAVHIRTRCSSSGSQGLRLSAALSDTVSSEGVGADVTGTATSVVEPVIEARVPWHKKPCGEAVLAAHTCRALLDSAVITRRAQSLWNNFYLLHAWYLVHDGARLSKELAGESTMRVLYTLSPTRLQFSSHVNYVRSVLLMLRERPRSRA